MMSKKNSTWGGTVGVRACLVRDGEVIVWVSSRLRGWQADRSSRRQIGPGTGPGIGSGIGKCDRDFEQVVDESLRSDHVATSAFNVRVVITTKSSSWPGG